MPSIEVLWPEPPADLVLPQGEVHLWAAPLDLADEALRRCEAVLSEDERARAAKFRTGPLRDHYTAARGTLRMLLGRYLEADPTAFPLAYQPHGKPEFGPPWHERGPEFNLSHSGGLVMYAFTRGAAVGVDVEHVHDMPNAAALLERFFSADEIAQWQRTPPQRQGLVFFQGWTRKEAWLKAVGSGLSFPLDQFCVTMDGPARVLSIRGDTAEASQWHLESLDHGPDYVGAVAVHGAVATVRKWRWAGI